MGIFNNGRSLIQKANANQGQGQMPQVNPFMGNRMIDRAKTMSMPGNQMVPNAISPVALTNQSTIRGLFNRTNQGPLAQTADQGQMTSQGYMPAPDPTNYSQQNDVNAVMAETGDVGQGYSQPVPPPYGVQTPITPNYDLNNQ